MEIRTRGIYCRGRSCEGGSRRGRSVGGDLTMEEVVGEGVLEGILRRRKS